MKIGNWKLEIIFFAAIFFCGVFTLPHSTQAATVTWTGAGADNNWSTSGNWTGGTGVPTSADDVVFSGDTGTYPNADKDTTWDSSGPGTVKSVNFQVGYAGNVTISKASVTVAGSWTWAGTGSFSAGTGQIVFTSTGTWTPGSVSYYDIKTNQGSGHTLTVSGTATVTHNFDLAGTNNGMTFSGGTINIAGNISCTAGSSNYCATVASTTSLVINGTGDQTLSSNSSGGGYFPPITVNKSSGTLTLSGTIYALNWTFTAGTVNAGTSTVSFANGNTINSGSMHFYNVTFYEQNNTITLSSAMYVDHNFSLTHTSGFIVINGANIYVAGNYTSSATTYNSGSTAVVVMSGTGAQTLSVSGGGVIDNITIDKPSGTLTLSGTIPVQGNWTHTKGTIDPGSSTLSFTASSTFTPGSASYYNLNFASTGFTITVSGTAVVLNNLTSAYSGGFGSAELSGGSISVWGNLTCTGTVCFSSTSTTNIIIGGAGSQTLSTSGGNFPPITINKPSGTLFLSGVIPLQNNWTYTTGRIDATGSTLQIKNTLSMTPGSSVQYNDLDLPQGSVVTLSGNFNIRNLTSSYSGGTGTLGVTGGTINVGGNMTCSGTVCITSDAIIVLNGNEDQSITGSGGGGFGSITVNKPGGILSLLGTVNVRNWSVLSGKVSSGTSNLSLNASSVASFTPGPVSYYDVTLNTGGTLNLMGDLVTSNAFVLGNTGGGTFVTNNYKITTKNFSGIYNTAFTAGSSVIKVSGNFTRTSGAFTAGTSTIILNGTNQTISGTTTFYNLYKLLPEATTDTLTFTAGTTYTIASGGTARFIGTRGYPLSVQSSSAGSAFTLTKTGNVIAEYVSLKDCTVSSATSAPASTNVSGNTNWTFTKEFVSTIRATGGDYTTLSSWESALGTVDLTAAATKVFAHGGITGTIADNTAVTGATSGATGTAVHTTSTQMLIKSITGTFQSGEQIRVDVSNYVTSSDTGNGAIAVAEAYNDWPNALNDSVTISGETTDADNFILITVPASQQHGGKLKDTASNYYRGFTLKPSASTAIVLDNQQSYTRIEGVAVDGTNATATNIRLNGTSPFATRLLSAGGVDGISLSGGAIVLNSLARDGTGKCFEDTTGATTNYTVYNSTARGCAYGFHGDNTTTAITLKNVLGSANTTADFALTNTGAKSVTYSASSDATADDFGTTTGDRVSQTFSFIDATNKDFHLAPKDAGARNYGLDLLSDSTYPITKDIDNDVRPTVNPNDSSEVSYDMGMDEADYDTVRSGDGVILKDGVRLR